MYFSKTYFRVATHNSSNYLFSKSLVLSPLLRSRKKRSDYSPFHPKYSSLLKHFPSVRPVCKRARITSRRDGMRKSTRDKIEQRDLQRGQREEKRRVPEVVLSSVRRSGKASLIIQRI